MPAFITTLGMLLLLDGASIMYSHEATGAAKETLVIDYTKTVLGIPYPAVLLIVVGLVMAAVLARTVWGRNVYAVGGDPTLAGHAGVAVRRTRLTTYVVSGLLCGLCAIVLLGRAGVGDPTALQGYELQSITAAVVGGVSLAGGRGGVWGAIGGVAFLVVATTVLSLAGVEARYLTLAEGVLILLALCSYRPREARTGA
jgi:ribose/xylose/arabinose/galactoside ABC-type transport system permease subunit